MRTPLAAIFLFLASCSPGAALENNLTAQERAVIHGAINDISRGDPQALADKSPQVLATKITEALPAMRAAMPTPPLEVSAVTGSWSVTGQDRATKAVYEVHGRQGWALVNVSTLTSGGRTSLTGIYVERTSGPARDLDPFSLRSAGVAQVLMLIAMAASVAVTVAALLRIWTSGYFRRRWLWTIGALVGFTTLRLDWTTGAFDFQPLTVLFFNVGAVKAPVYAPWILSVGIPLVAIISLFRHRSANADGASA